MNFYEYEISSPYGERVDPITNKASFHNGIDYAIPSGTEIKSNVSGTVTRSEFEKDGFGNYVVIKDGTGKLHYYAHLTAKALQVGDVVNVNDTIGWSGSTGRSTGPHLHYEVRESHNIYSKSYDPNLFTSESYFESINSIDSNIKSWEDFGTFDIKGKTQLILFNIFKFIIMALLIVLFVVLITKSMDINI